MRILLLNRKKNSFSLIEVVIATGILMMFLAAGLVLTTSALRNVASGKNRVQATMFANRIIEETRVIRDTAFYKGTLDFDQLVVDLRSNLNIPAGTDEACFNQDGDSVPCSSGSVFYRAKFNLDKIDLGGGDALKITVAVNWTDFGLGKNITIPTYLRGCGETNRKTTVRFPIDAMNVLDISGSMSWSWSGNENICGQQPLPAVCNCSLSETGSNPCKIVSAKKSLKTFNRQLALGKDRAGLTVFPIGSSPSGWSTKYWGGVKIALTLLTSSVRDSMENQINQLSAAGSTPLASALLEARSELTSKKAETRPQAVIIASDGIANVDINSQLQVSGSGPTNQSIEQATLLKSDGVYVFTIGIGGDADETALSRIASSTCGSNKDRPCYFFAASDNDLVNIYKEIAKQISDLATVEVCPR